MRKLVKSYYKCNEHGRQGCRNRFWIGQAEKQNFGDQFSFSAKFFVLQESRGFPSNIGQATAYHAYPGSTTLAMSNDHFFQNLGFYSGKTKNDRRRLISFCILDFSYGKTENATDDRVILFWTFAITTGKPKKLLALSEKKHYLQIYGGLSNRQSRLKS